MVDFTETFQKCLGHLYPETRFVKCIKNEQVFDHKGIKLAIYAPEHGDDPLIERVKTQKRSFDARLAESFERLEHMLRERDERLKLGARQLIPEHIRPQLELLSPPEGANAYERAFESVFEGMAESSFSEKNRLLETCPHPDTLIQKALDHIEDSFKTASQALTIGLNEAKAGGLLGFYYEQTARSLGLEPLSYDTLDLFPRDKAGNGEDYVTIGVAEPKLYRSDVRHMNQDALTPVFKEAGRLMCESKDNEKSLIKQTASSLIDILNEQLLKQVKDYEKKTRYAPQFNAIKFAAHKALKKSDRAPTFLRTAPPREMLTEHDQPFLKEKAYEQADIGRDLLHFQSGEILASYGDRAFSTQANNKGVMDKSYEAGGQKNYIAPEATDDQKLSDVALEFDR